MAYNYVVSAQKPTAVTHAVTANFTNASQANLIIAKLSTVEVHVMTPEGLAPLLEFPIYGRISALRVYRPAGEKSDLLFICTERYKFCVLAYDPVHGEIVTRANGDVKDRIGQPSDAGSISIIDPQCRVIGLHLYTGLFKVIPMDGSGALKEAFNVRLEELLVHDIVFLDGCPRATIAVLHKDTKEGRHISTYEVIMKEKELVAGPWRQAHVDMSARRLVPLPAPLGGVLALADTSITYFGGNGQGVSVTLSRPTIIRVIGKVDDSGARWVVGDANGTLYILGLTLSAGRLVTALTIEQLGETSIASCLCYLDNGVVFVGSTLGDSQIVRLSTTANEETGSFVSVLDTHTNLGPIVDFCVVDLDRQGQGQLVTCSGGFKDGSLRIVRNGIGITEHSSLEVPGVKGVWSLRGPDSPFDKYLVLAFTTALRVLSISGEEMEEAEVAGLLSEGPQTILCANVTGSMYVQVTKASVRLVSGHTTQLEHEWIPPSGAAITLAAANDTQILVALAGGRLVYLEVRGSLLVSVAEALMDHEIACVDVSGGEGSGSGPSQLVAVGLWTDISVRVLTLPTLTQVIKEELGGDVGIPRSIAFATMEGGHYVFVGMGDGHIFSFTLDIGAATLKDRKKMTLGSQPILLSRFGVEKGTHVFAASDRPTVVYANVRKILYSNVNVKEVTYVCPFSSESFPSSLVLASETALTIGSIDSIQKLHKQTVPLGEMPRRIAHVESADSFAVLTVKFTHEDNGEETETNFVRLIEDQSYESVFSYELGKREVGLSIMALKLDGGGESGEDYVIVGTAFVIEGESEVSSGRLLAFRVENKTLELVGSCTTKGAVHCLTSIGAIVVAGVNNLVQAFEWKTSEDGLVREFSVLATHQGHITCICVRARGEFVLVGDVMKSLSLLLYKPATKTFEEVAKDFRPMWIMQMDILTDELFLGTDHYANLFTVKRNTDTASDEERGRLELVGEYHLGDMINSIHGGSLVMRTPDADVAPIPTVLFGCVSGAIGVLARLPEEDFVFFSKVQEHALAVVKGVGGLKHKEWRSFLTDTKARDARNFLDGDLIESILELSPSKVAEVVKGLGITAEELCKRVEDLARRLH